MRKVISIVATGVLATLMGCGGSTTSPANEPIVADGCNAPSCVTERTRGCAPSGTCTMQMQVTGLADYNVCYSNGVKRLSKATYDSTTPTPTYEMVLTTKKDNAVCYSLAIPLSASTDPNSAMPMNFRNAAGTTVATISSDSKTKTVSVTCTGGQPVVLNDKCDKTLMTNTSADGNSCTQGVCEP